MNTLDDSLDQIVENYRTTLVFLRNWMEKCGTTYLTFEQDGLICSFRLSEESPSR